MSTLIDVSVRRTDNVLADPVGGRLRPESADDLTAPIRGRLRAQRALEQAEVLFVARVVQDGGIGPWRRLTESRFLAARRAFTGRGRLSRGEAAALVVALTDAPVRDRCWLQVEAGPDQEWIAFWRYLTRQALPPYRAQPLFLLGWSAWRVGDYVLAEAAADATAVEEPGHRGAAMLKAIVRRRLDPRLLPPLCEHDAQSRGAR